MFKHRHQRQCQRWNHVHAIVAATTMPAFAQMEVRSSAARIGTKKRLNGTWKWHDTGLQSEDQTHCQQWYMSGIKIVCISLSSHVSYMAHCCTPLCRVSSASLKTPPMCHRSQHRCIPTTMFSVGKPARTLGPGIMHSSLVAVAYEHTGLPLSLHVPPQRPDWTGTANLTTLIEQERYGICPIC